MRPVVVEAVDIKRSGEDVFGYRTRVRNEVALSFIKATHTLAWLSIESDMAYVLLCGCRQAHQPTRGPGGRGRSRRKPHLLRQPTRQNVLLCAVATDRQLTVKAVPNGGYSRAGAGPAPLTERDPTSVPA
jgi:hypothetical protein